MTGSVTVRRRTPDDVAGLTALLAAGQATSGYPMRWPLPFPVEQFIVRPNELAAWTAEVDGQPAGHVSVVAADSGPLVPDWTRAHGVPADRLGVLSVLFVDTGLRRTGVGRRLHDAAVDWMRSQRLAPCLDVVPVHEAASALYAALGWREVCRARPDWLPEGAPDVVGMVLPVS